MNPEALIRRVHDGEAPLRIDVHKADHELIGHLSPLTRNALSDDALMARLSQWRNQARASFLTQFEATPERTRRWLEEVVLTDPTRMILLIHSPGRLIGQIGFKGLRPPFAELDNLIRGEGGGDAQLIPFSEIALIRWLFDTFQVSLIEANVLSNNILTLNLHRSIGFRRERSVPLLRKSVGEETHLEPCAKTESSGPNLEVIRLTRGRLNTQPE